MITLYHDVTRAPVEIARLLRDEMIVTPYRKPDKVGHIYLPATALADKTQTLWEVLAASDGACAAAGFAIPVNAIVQTLRRWPRDMRLQTLDARPAFLLSVQHCGLRGIITYTEEEADGQPE